MALFFWTVLYNLVFGKVYDFPGTKDLAKDLLYGKCTIIPGFTITNWFFFALLGIYVLFPFLKKSLDDVSSFEYYKYFIGYLLLLFFGSNIICRLGNLVLFVFGIKSFPLNMMLIFPRLNIIFENGYALVYFIVGGLISKNYDKIMTLNKSKLVLGIVIGVIVNYAYGLIYTFNSTGSFDNMYNNVWNGYPSISILVASSCLVLLVLNMEKEQKCDVSLFDRVAVIVSNNTMGIYFFHLLIGNLINCYYKQYAQWCISLPYVFLIFVLSLLCSILVSKTPVIRKMVKF